ncbi:hypothetical protein [Haliscomenobacter sp.]|uniref:hypothetical protein n=1 Tax=Haliscomenobacter sp. TaxID=2717303 RepID=UPI0035948B2A
MKKANEAKLAGFSGGISCHDLMHQLTWMIYYSENELLQRQAFAIHRLLGKGYTLCTPEDDRPSGF